ncbi:hypothetical protein QQP08_026511, partial [Theobroma cacao]
LVIRQPGCSKIKPGWPKTNSFPPEFPSRKSSERPESNQNLKMASSWKVMSRLSSRLQSPTLKLNKTSLSALQSTSDSSVRRISRVSRLALGLSSVGSMMPLHSAIASSRLVSSLASESGTWSLVPQGCLTYFSFPLILFFCYIYSKAEKYLNAFMTASFCSEFLEKNKDRNVGFMLRPFSFLFSMVSEGRDFVVHPVCLRNAGCN